MRQRRLERSVASVRPHRGSGARDPVYGAVDLGTNNCRMLMAKPADGGLRVVGSFSRIVRLGEGLADGGRLHEPAIARTIAALGICADRMREQGVRRIRSVATEACRRAGNCAAFLDRVRAQTGLELETISTWEEARLTLTGCMPLLDPRRPRALVFDIGGGSTEIMWIDQSNGRAPRILDLLSIPGGVVTLAERHGGENVSPRTYAEIVAWVLDNLGAFDAGNGIGREVARGRVQMLGTSGTVTTLGAFHLGLPVYDRRRVDGLDIGFEDVAAVSTRLAAMGFAERAAHSCIGRQRADLVVVGCAVLDAICRRWPVGSVRVADRGIREGLLRAMMAADGAGPAGGPP